MSSPIPEPLFHLFIAGIVAVGISCVPLLDATQQAAIHGMDHCNYHLCLIVKLLLIVILIFV